MVVWEAVQKENYLSRLEKQKKDSEGEVLRQTAHRCRPGPLQRHTVIRPLKAGRGPPPAPRSGSELGRLGLRGRGRVRLSGTRHPAS